MAYDSNQYQPPQRAHNGRAAQRNGPPHDYEQPLPPQQQQYPPQHQYDQYPQDGYGYDGYGNGNGNGYAHDYNDGYGGMNGGGGGNPYPPQDSYPPHQEYYDDGAGAMPPRAVGRGGPPPRQRPPMNDGRRGPPQQRPAMSGDAMRGDDHRGGGQGRRHPGSGPVARGGRPAPPDRNASDPGIPSSTQQPLKTPPLSPPHRAWDNPFPTFPGAKSAAARDEQNMIQSMGGMDIQDIPQNQPGRVGSKGSQDRYGNSGRTNTFDDYKRPSLDNHRMPPDNYGRPPVDRERNMAPRGYHPQGPQEKPRPGYSDHQRGPPGGYGEQLSHQNVYTDGYDDRENFRSPGRSMTLPNEPPMQRPFDGHGTSASYHGPAGRSVPPRPATASGARSTAQKQYTAPVPLPQQTDYRDQGPYGHKQAESISEFYDSYYDDPTPDPRTRRPLSAGSEMPNFDAIPIASASHKPGASIDDHIAPGVAPVPQPTGYQQGKPNNHHPDFRAQAQAQPQAAVFEMAHDTPPMPSAYQQDPYNEYGGFNGNPGQPPGPSGYGEYDEHSAAHGGFQPAPQGIATVPRTSPAPNFQNGLPGPGGPRNGYNRFPKGPSPQNGGLPPNGSMIPKTLSEDALPSHPAPYRPGLSQNPGGSQPMNNKPIPVRNYNGIPANASAPLSPAAPMPQGPQPVLPAPGVPTPQQPVTVGELEQLRQQTKINPNDQKLQMLLVRKLVEAADVIAPAMTDQKMRTKSRERYVMDAHKLLKKLVTQTNVEAMFYLADCHGRGSLGLEMDHKEAFTLYQNAAKIGHPAAAYRTAVCCELGNEDGGGTKKDPLKAIQWYKRAAMLGDTPAMYKMGMILLKGLLGQPKNPREAVGWLKRAADKADADNPHALHELALLFEGPQAADGSIIRDEAYSFSLFQQAADLGYKFSQYRLGCAFEYGLFNCPIDPRLSITWYSRAAVQEEHQAELALSGWYLTGSDGVLQQSDTEAYLWARKAAIARLAKAEYAMGYFTEVGIGAPSSLEDAKRWYWRAAAQNFPQARDRLEDLKRNGGKGAVQKRERISRSKVGKQNEGECAVM